MSALIEVNQVVIVEVIMTIKGVPSIAKAVKDRLRSAAAASLIIM